MEKKIKKSNLIDRYTMSLIKENLIYLVLLIINIIFLLVVNIVFKENILTKKQQIEDFESEIKTYRAIKSQIDSLDISTQKIDEYYQLVNLFLPEQQNIFSIIAALERLSEQTGFRIISYNIVPPNENSEEFVIKISGESSPQQFLEFLRKYTFDSGRLITAKQIEYLAENTNPAIELTFYSKKQDSKIDPIQITLPSQEDIEYIENIASKIRFVFEDISEEDYFYPTKDKLF